MTRSLPTIDRAGASDRIRAAGIVLFKARGYHGTSVRALAQAVGIEAASLYHHFPSKQKILADIFNRTMDDFIEGLERALEGAEGHEERLRAAVRFHILFHIERQDEAFISHSELRSLTPANRRRVNVQRDRYATMLRAFLAEGKKVGSFEIADVWMTTVAILMMCSGVSDWFAKRGRLSPGIVADAYANMVLRLVVPAGSAPSGQATTTRRRSPSPGARGAQPASSRPRPRT
jgi:AcrR family transcriptional regulator